MRLIWLLLTFYVSQVFSTINFVPENIPFKSNSKFKFINFEESDFGHLMKKQSDQYYIDWYDESKANLDLIPLFFQLDEKNLNLWKKHDDYTSIFDNGICFTDQCAMANLYSKAEGARIAYLKNHFNINASFYRFQDYVISPEKRQLDLIIKKFSVDELESLVRAIKSYPSFLRNFEKREVHAMRITKTFEDPISIANARMMYFDLWSKSDEWFQVYASIHELAHRIGSYYEIDESTQWKNVAEVDYKNYRAGKKSCVTKYIHSYLSNPKIKIEKIITEDFAEMVTMYMSKPIFMKSTCVDKYRFLKETVFRGAEIPVDDPSEGSILKLGKDFVSVEKNISKEMENWLENGSTKLFSQNYQNCKGVYLADLKFNEYVEEYLSCWGEKEYFKQLEKNMGNHSFLYPQLVTNIFKKDFQKKMELQKLIDDKTKKEKISQIKQQMYDSLLTVIKDLIKEKARYMNLYRKDGKEMLCYHFWLGEADGSYITSHWSQVIFKNYDWGLGNLKNKHLFKPIEENMCSYLHELYGKNKNFAADITNKDILKLIPTNIKDSLSK